MTAAPAAVTVLEKTLDDAARTLYTEAVEGPAMSGISEIIHFGSDTIEASASSSWGVHLSRHSAEGTKVVQLRGDDITVEAITAAMVGLLSA